MPPPEAERPPSADTAAVLTWAKTGLAVAAKVRRAEGGRVAIRRLNRLEYENTLHDLLGLPLPLRDLLPEDGTSDGFDTASAALAISPVHMQRFMDAARTALEAVAVRGPRPETKVRRFSYDPEKDQFLKHPNNEPMIRVRNGEMLFFSEPHGEVPAVASSMVSISRSTPPTWRRCGSRRRTRPTRKAPLTRSRRPRRCAISSSRCSSGPASKPTGSRRAPGRSQAWRWREAVASLSKSFWAIRSGRFRRGGGRGRRIYVA